MYSSIHSYIEECSTYCHTLSLSPCLYDFNICIISCASHLFNRMSLYQLLALSLLKYVGFAPIRVLPCIVEPAVEIVDPASSICLTYCGQSHIGFFKVESAAVLTRLLHVCWVLTTYTDACKGARMCKCVSRG